MHMLCEHAESIYMTNELVTSEFTKHELNFVDVMMRLREALKLESDAELSRVLGISTSNFSNRKTANSLPLEAIVQVCLEKSIHMGWLFGGTYTKHELSAGATNGVIDLKLLGAILAELGYAMSPAYDPEKHSHAQGYADSDRYGNDLFKGLIVGTIYNEVVSLKGKKQRQAIFEKTGRLAVAAPLYDLAREAEKKPFDD